MTQTASFVRSTAFVLYAALAVGVALYSLGFLFGAPDLTNRFDVSFADLQSLAVPAHFFLGGVALLLTPLQLISAIQRRHPRIHRLIGLLYTVSVLLAALAAFSLAPTAQSGWVATSGFITLAVLWVAVTAYAWQRAVSGDYGAHARWMYRSIALTSSAISLRIMLGLGIPVAGLPLDLVYPIASWACWILNLGVCEWLLRSCCGTRSASFLHSA